MKVKKLIICFIITVLVIVAGYIILSSVFKEEKENDKPINGKDISKEEYIYKEELLTLGYTSQEIETIENKISDSNVKEYLLTKKYDNLTSFIKSPYFDITKLDRYENYANKNTEFTGDQVVLYVEIGLDIEFYTNIKVVENYKEVDTIVNKYNQLPEDASFDDLVTLQKPYSNNGRRTRKVSYDHFVEMVDAASKDGIKLYAVSGFRTWSQQNSLFNNAKKKSLEEALWYSAKPGHSEHQLGLALDINTANSDTHFENSKEYEWLKQNSYKYGFVERYPKDKEFITGYAFEPWHYRYFGVDIATTMVEEDITYEEYLVIHKK